MEQAISAIPARGRGGRESRRHFGFALFGSLTSIAATVSLGLVAAEIGERRSFDSYPSSSASTSLIPTSSAPLDSSAMNVNFTAADRDFEASSTHRSAAASRTTKIALIGDSWVSKSKMDAVLADALAELGRTDLEVEGLGEGGATSRRILRNLLGETGEATSSRRILNDREVSHCVVIAGVNDSAQHLGPDYYAHHTIAIARALLAHGITPLILEVPEYGIEEVRAERKGLGLVKDMVLSALFDDGEVDVVRKYRSALRERLTEAEQSDLIGRVELIEFDSVVADYDETSSKALYRDQAHLNEDGRSLLAQHLAEAIDRRLDADNRGSSVQLVRAY